MESDNLSKLVINKKTTFNFHISFMSVPSADSSQNNVRDETRRAGSGITPQTVLPPAGMAGPNYCILK